MKITDVLNEREQVEIQKIIESPVLKEALRKILLFGIYYNGTLKAGENPDPLINFYLNRANNMDISDEQLGHDARVSAEAIFLLEDGFKQIDKFKITNEPEADTANPAR